MRHVGLRGIVSTAYIVKDDISRNALRALFVSAMPEDFQECEWLGNIVAMCAYLDEPRIDD